MSASAHVTDRRQQYRDRLQVFADNHTIRYLEILLYRKWRDQQWKKELQS